MINDCLKFPSIIKDVTLAEDEELVSYDVESLFTSIPINETIDHICNEIYRCKVLKPLCKESIFRKLLRRLSSDCLFTVNNRLMKQIDGCPMGGPISVVFSGIYMNKMEKDVVIPMNPSLYKRYVDDTCAKRKKNQPDLLFQQLNNYHPNIKLTIEVDPKRCLDTELIHDENKFKTKVHEKS